MTPKTRDLQVTKSVDKLHHMNKQETEEKNFSQTAPFQAY
jgi:hypothetical protein